MKVRVKFEKTGINKYIGHLDLLRYFQKAMRRAGIDMKYTEGFSPHPVLSFAAPLGLGLTTRGDYYDTELETDRTVGDFVARMNAQMTDGIRVLSVSEIEAGKKQNAMASLAASGYELTLSQPVLQKIGGPDGAAASWERFLAQPEILIEKETKSAVAQADIRPLIYGGTFSDDVLTVTVSASSAANLRPDTLLTAFLSFCGMEKTAEEMLKDGEIGIERTEMYTRAADGALITLAEAGRPITQQ